MAQKRLANTELNNDKYLLLQVNSSAKLIQSTHKYIIYLFIHYFLFNFNLNILISYGHFF